MMKSYATFIRLKSRLKAIKAVIKKEKTIIASENGTIKKFAAIEINEN